MKATGRRGPARVERLDQAASGALRETVVLYGKSSYLVRYRVTDDAVIITRIWHGKENRPR